MDAHNACVYCHITFALAEKKVRVLNKDYHEDCNKKRIRKMRIRDFLLANRGQIFLDITPKHRFGR